MRRGDLSPSEVVAAAITRARRIDPHVRGIASEDFERALQIAPTRNTGAFAGVPTFIKDMTDVEGVPTRAGSAAFANVGPAKRTAPIAAQMFAMGMTALGKSTLPEFGFTASTEFPDSEPTRNPWNLRHSAGGSSGGAAALVAAGVVPIAHGADGGGSIRIPAACCGLVGLKSTRGRIVGRRQTKLLPIDIVAEGVLTRSVRDTARYFAEAEKLHRNPKLEPVGHVVDPIDRPLRIAVIRESPSGVPLDAPTQRVLDETITRLQTLGHEIHDIEVPIDPRFAADFVHYWAMLAFSISALGKVLFDSSFERSKLSDLTVGLARRFRGNIHHTPGVIYRMRRFAAEHADVFKRVDVILSPTLTARSPEIGHLGMHLPFDVLFPRVEEWVGFTPLANATGAPAISLPLGLDSATNLPIGMMFGAAHGKEALLLQLALQLEQAHPWSRIDEVADDDKRGQSR